MAELEQFFETIQKDVDASRIFTPSGWESLGEMPNREETPLTHLFTSSAPALTLYAGHLQTFSTASK